MTIEEESKKTVFLIDDDSEDRQFVKEAFWVKTKEIMFVEFLSGEELLDFVKSSKLKLRPSLIIMDVNMPRMNGLETLQAIRADPVFGCIPVIIMTTSNSKTLSDQALLGGADGFISKPVSFEGYIQVCSELTKRLV